MEKYNYEYIDSLIQDYQNNSKEAAQLLLTCFGYDAETGLLLSGYLGKYFRLLRHGDINFWDKDTRFLINCFIDDIETRKAMRKNYQYANTKAIARRSVQAINDKLKYLSDEDLISELCILFLERCKKYKKVRKKVNFCGYLFNSYRYDIKSMIIKLDKANMYDLEESVDSYVDKESEISLDTMEDLYFQNENDTLGLNWIHGKTANFPFNKLSIEERTLLSLRYKGYSLEKTGAYMGYHRDTIWYKEKNIKKKIEPELKKMRLLK